MDQQLLARKIKVETNLTCDLQIEGHPRVIPKGTYATQVVGEGIKAQGIFHGKQCYEAALKQYEELEDATGIKNQSD